MRATSSLSGVLHHCWYTSVNNAAVARKPAPVLAIKMRSPFRGTRSFAPCVSRKRKGATTHMHSKHSKMTAAVICASWWLNLTFRVRKAIQPV